MERDTQILRKQLSIFGTWNSAYSDTHKSDWNLVVDAMAKGMINAKKLITHKFDLATMDKGLDIMKNNTEFFIDFDSCVYFNNIVIIIQKQQNSNIN